MTAVWTAEIKSGWLSGLPVFRIPWQEEMFEGPFRSSDGKTLPRQTMKHTMRVTEKTIPHVRAVLAGEQKENLYWNPAAGR